MIGPQIKINERTSLRKSKLNRAGGSVLLFLLFPVEEIVVGNLEDFCDRFDFQIGNETLVIFDAGNYIFIHVISVELQAVGQHSLGHVMALAKIDQSFTDQIFFSGCRSWLGHILTPPVNGRKNVSLFALLLNCTQT